MTTTNKKQQQQDAKIAQQEASQTRIEEQSQQIFTTTTTALFNGQREEGVLYFNKTPKNDREKLITRIINNNNNNNSTISKSCQACLSIVAAKRRRRRRRNSLKLFDLSNNNNNNSLLLEETHDHKNCRQNHHRHRKRPWSTFFRSSRSSNFYLQNFVLLIIISVPAALTSPIYSSSSSLDNLNLNNNLKRNQDLITSHSSSSSLSSLTNNKINNKLNSTYYPKNASSGSWYPHRGPRNRRSMPGSAGTVATNLGLVQGRLVQLPNTNIEIYEFLGIPYAEPPVGERRFRKPVPKQPWKDILDATARPNSCPQLLDSLFETFEGATMWNANTDMSEDCLYLNIWVPRRVLDDLSRTRYQSGDNSKGLHPVLIWIFGGGFTSGTATLDIYDGRILSGYNNIIVASMQYRLGALGFLYFGVDDAPGNMGMWDQLLALKWTCENIHNFGGDCRNTTIFGESAGAASVSLHLLSPYSREYFQRAVMESASALSGWAVLTQEEAAWRSEELVTKFSATCAPPPSATSGASESDSLFGSAPTPPPSSKNAFDETRWKIDCLRSQQFLRLPEEEWGVLASDPAGYGQFPFVPVIDGDFLPRHPRDLLADGQYYNVSVLMGLNKNEGSYFMLYTTKGFHHFKHPKAPNRQMNFTTRVFSELVRDYFAYYPHFNRSSSQIVLDAIEFQYTPWRLPVITSQDIISAVDSATGDWAFACPVISWADSYVELPPSPMSNPLGKLSDYSSEPVGTGAGGGVSIPVGNNPSAFVEPDSSSVRYVRLKRSFASGFSYLQQPTGNSDPNNPTTGSGGTAGGTAMPAMRNPDSIYSSIPENDLWYSKHKVFLYYFSQRSSQNPWPAWMGVLHADEIAFVFGEPFNYSKPYTDEEKMLSRFMMAYWSNFAKFGDPNVRDRSSPNQVNLDLPPWPEYSYYEKTFLELSVDTLVTKRQPAVGTSIKAQECAFWHGYLPKLDALSANVNKVEYDWKKSFYHWKFALLPEWEAQFRKFTVAQNSQASQVCRQSQQQNSPPFNRRTQQSQSFFSDDGDL